MQLSEEQFAALETWIKHLALEAVANDRPMHNRLPKMEDDYNRGLAHYYLVEGAEQ